MVQLLKNLNRTVWRFSTNPDQEVLNISQGSAGTCLMNGGIFNDDFSTYSLSSLTVHTHPRFTVLFLGPPGWANARSELPDLWCKWRLTEGDTPTMQLGATPSGLTSAHLHHPPICSYRPDALPAAQPTAGEWVSSFLTAHQHILGYLVPYNGEKVIKMWRYNQVYLATINEK